MLTCLGEGAALGDDDDLGSGELLLELWEEVALNLAAESALLVWNSHNRDLDAVGFVLLDTGDLEVGERLLQALFRAGGDFVEDVCNLGLDWLGFALFHDPCTHEKGHLQPPKPFLVELFYIGVCVIYLPTGVWKRGDVAAFDGVFRPELWLIVIDERLPGRFWLRGENARMTFSLAIGLTAS